MLAIDLQWLSSPGLGILTSSLAEAYQDFMLSPLCSEVVLDHHAAAHPACSYQMKGCSLSSKLHWELPPLHPGDGKPTMVPLRGEGLAGLSSITLAGCLLEIAVALVVSL